MEVAAVDAVGDHFLLPSAELHQALAVLVFYVDHGHTRRFCARSLKENCLGGEIIFHGAVIVEMVAGQVREDGNVEWNAVDALLLQRVRGDFHHRLGAPSVEGAREELIQLESFRSGVRSGIGLVLDAIFDGPNQRCLAPAGAQHGIEKERRRGLAVRSRDPRDRQLFCGTAVEVRAQACERSPSVLHLRPGNIVSRRKRIADDRNRACLQCSIDIAIAVRALPANGDETPARLYSATVIIQPGNRRIALLRDVLRAVQEVKKIHRRKNAMTSAYRNIDTWQKRDLRLTRYLERSMESKITTNGRVTIPKAIRDRLRLQPGDRMQFFVNAYGVVALRPKRRGSNMRPSRSRSTRALS